MTTRKKYVPNPDGPDAAILAELFDTVDYNPGIAFSKLESATLGRIIAAVTALGGMVTFYGDRSNNIDSFSIRFGERKAAYGLDVDGPNDTICEQLANRYEQAVAKMKASQVKPK